MAYQESASFTLQDLGLLTGPPVKGFDAVVSLASSVLQTRRVALVMVDMENGAMFLRASHGLNNTSFPLFGSHFRNSMASEICEKNRTLQIDDVSSSTLSSAVETAFFGAKACLGTPVHDPAGAPVGMLIALHTTSHQWTSAQREALEAFAYLASQQIMLKASFETLKLMKRSIPLA